MIADTNVLLRALDGDPGVQGRAARERVTRARDTGERLTVLSATVLEVAYVLESARAGYGWDRGAVADSVEAIVDDPGLDVEHAGALRAAAASYRARSVDLHDCLLRALAKERGTKVLSFDDDLRRLGNHQRP
ncbi:MAG: PIN domain-containing protein [Solirubrobacteraceae bacterium]